MASITTRAGKGASLSWNEADANFINLNNDKLEASALAPYETSAHAAATYVTSNNPNLTGTVTASGDIVLTGTGKRITGDFSNATVANRVMFQTSTVNGQTSIGVLPNGTSTFANLDLFGGSDPANASIGQLVNTGTEVRLSATVTGTGTLLPMAFYTGGAERMRIDTSGVFHIAYGNQFSLGLSANQINSSPAYNDTAELAINYSGYNGGTTQFRDTTIFNGKNNAYARFLGSDRTFTIGDVTRTRGNAYFYAEGNSGYTCISRSSSVAIDGALDIRSNWGATDRWVFQTRADGNVYNYNNVYGALSDASIKENITDATPKLNDLLQVRIRNFNIIGDSVKQIGVIAQEVEEIFPGLISSNADGLKSVKYSVFVPLLIKAIQELKAEFDAYKATHP